MITEACTSLAGVCVVWVSGSSLERSALCFKTEERNNDDNDQNRKTYSMNYNH